MFPTTQTAQRSKLSHAKCSWMHWYCKNFQTEYLYCWELEQTWRLYKRFSWSNQWLGRHWVPCIFFDRLEECIAKPKKKTDDTEMHRSGHPLLKFSHQLQNSNAIKYTIIKSLLVSCLAVDYVNVIKGASGAPNGNFRENICSEDDLRSRIFGAFVIKFLICLPLLGFSNIYNMV